MDRTTIPLPLVESDLTLRQFRWDDKEAILRLGNNENVSRYLTYAFPNPYLPENADAWLSFVTSDDQAHNLAIEWKGQFVGGIGINVLTDVHSRTGEVGYWLGEPFWRKGIMPRAVSLFVPYAFANFNLLRIQACVFAGNGGSMRVLEKCQFVKEAIHRKYCFKHGTVYDGHMYARLAPE
ncbi:putative GNAT family N-acetyltransferase [Blattamonas nauphoetae]|uniref:GNAT family N-acetyltransferase n=1 Tax=Blattamonas nauphoetae TaxID=2049346 RepID=A0ABQ9YAV3_9EUKA|nr:putative GNAT family N-acetyltransferase [Blattamonas nauphoetae]